MTSNHQHSFWANGLKAYLKELSRQEAEALTPLQKQLKAATDLVLHQEIMERIEKVASDFEEKRRDSSSSLFFGSGSDGT